MAEQARTNGIVSSSISISNTGPGGDPSGGRSAVTDSSTAQRASSDPLSAASLPEPQKQLLEDTSLSRFFPLCAPHSPLFDCKRFSSIFH